MLLQLYKYIFLFSEYGVKLAKDDLFANILPNMLELTDYEEQYMTPEERKNRGFQVKHGSYKWIIMLEKCGRPDLNVFHLK